MAGARGHGLSGETDLDRLLDALKPRLFDRPYDFVPWSRPGLPEGEWLALVNEDEQLCAIVPHDDGEWARISLQVHSSLSAVGLTAAISTGLAACGISANVIAGRYHDHLLVPWPHRHQALAAIEQLAGR